MHFEVSFFPHSCNDFKADKAVLVSWLQILEFKLQFFHLGQTSFQGKIQSQGVSSDGIPQITSTDSFTVRGISRNTIQVKHESGSIYIFVAPCSVFTGIHSKSVGISMS